MPKHRKKDRPFLSASEWSNDFGGYKEVKRKKIDKRLPFECCALSLQPFKDPALIDGILFDYEAILKFIQHYKKSPVNGKVVHASDIIRLNMRKNVDDQWHCPVSCQVFGINSKIVAILPSRNVYAYQVVKQLCGSSSSVADFLEPSISFNPRTDIVKLYDPEDIDLCTRRDLSNFYFLEEQRRLFASNNQERTQIKHSASSLRILEEARKVSEQKKQMHIEKTNAKTKKQDESQHFQNSLHTATFFRIKALKPTTMDVRESSQQTGGKTSGSLTSTSLAVSTSSQLRLATDNEIQEARWRFLRALKQRGFVRLETTLGPLNFEIRADVAPAAAENFLALCAHGRYDAALFYRIIPGFMAQAGDDDNRSAWNQPFRDEFDARLSHNSRGILAYAHPGKKDYNTSQFYITFGPCLHLDNRHTVFGKLVGGHDTLDLIEAQATDDDDKPYDDIKIIQATVFQDPTPQADIAFEKYVQTNMKNQRITTTQPSAPRPSERRFLPSTKASSSTFNSSSDNNTKQRHTTSTIGKYLKQ
mmetsp:Transcript_13207/g.17625  ORF Transcript_13207/g.17625 Transcript_13207/m.17625 type:complete len:532 (+) Transcript_13207:63-1658(+)